MLIHLQTLKASTALLKHIKSEAQRKATESSTKSLLATSDEDLDEGAEAGGDEPIWLTLTTKKHVADKKRLKPGKITVPHSVNSSPNSIICLITADPQRAFKDTIAHPAFPASLSKRITRIIGLKKLQERYKSFESRRQLLREHDIFLADDRIITRLPQILGKAFYKGSKKPIPVNLEAYKPKDDKGKRQKPAKTEDSKRDMVAQPAQVAREIERTLSTVQVYLSPSVTTSVRVGLASFTPQQLVENIEAVVTGLVDKFVTQKWRNVRAVHIKGPTTMALPVWLTDELWIDEADVLGEEEAVRAIEAGKQKFTKRKGREDEEVEGKSSETREGADRKTKKLKGAEDGEMSQEMVLRREKLRAQKNEAREAAAGGEEEVVVKKQEVAKSVDEGKSVSVKKTKVTKKVDGGEIEVRTKIKKTKVIAAS